jgi:hypothetical protein
MRDWIGGLLSRLWQGKRGSLHANHERGRLMPPAAEFPSTFPLDTVFFHRALAEHGIWPETFPYLSPAERTLILDRAQELKSQAQAEVQLSRVSE